MVNQSLAIFFLKELYVIKKISIGGCEKNPKLIEKLKRQKYQQLTHFLKK